MLFSKQKSNQRMIFVDKILNQYIKLNFNKKITYKNAKMQLFINICFIFFILWKLSKIQGESKLWGKTLRGGTSHQDKQY